VTLQDGTGVLSRDLVNRLPSYPADFHSRSDPAAPRWKRAVSHGLALAFDRAKYGTVVAALDVCASWDTGEPCSNCWACVLLKTSVGF
jgi:hypothetical protein